MVVGRVPALPGACPGRGYPMAWGGPEVLAPWASVLSTCRENPEKVACGAPMTVAEVGEALVITQRVSTMLENDQSLPIFS